MESAETSKAESLSCDNCRAIITTEKFCTACGFPVRGTAEERMHYQGKVSSSQYWLKESKKKINEGKIVIYILAALTFIFGVFVGLSREDYGLMIVNLIICLLYLICAAWADKNPFGAILTSFVIYLTLQVVEAFVDPASLFQGIILKVVFIGVFIKGIRSATEAQRLIKELEQYKVKPVGSN